MVTEMLDEVASDLTHPLVDMSPAQRDVFADDGVRTYLQTIGQTPLLRPEQERLLGRTIKAGRAARVRAQRRLHTRVRRELLARPAGRALRDALAHAAAGVIGGDGDEIAGWIDALVTASAALAADDGATSDLLALHALLARIARHEDGATATVLTLAAQAGLNLTRFEAALDRIGALLSVPVSSGVSPRGENDVVPGGEEAADVLLDGQRLGDSPLGTALLALVTLGEAQVRAALESALRQRDGLRRGVRAALCATLDDAAVDRALEGWEADEVSIARGYRAEGMLVEANLRLVVAVARRYGGHGLDLDDLVQEGNLGLMRAAESYDPDRGFRFSTYAVWWIRQSVCRALANGSRLVRLPVHVQVAQSKVARTRNAMHDALGRDPAPDELAAATGLSAERLAELSALDGFWRKTVSLDQPVSEDGETMLGDLVPGAGGATAEDEVRAQASREEVRTALQQLNERERLVLALRYGLDTDHNYTLEEVGAQIGVTRERARQIEVQALRKLRHLTRLGLTTLSAPEQ